MSRINVVEILSFETSTAFDLRAVNLNAGPHPNSTWRTSTNAHTVQKQKLPGHELKDSQKKRFSYLLTSSPGSLA